jgi:hypothetical protein
MGTITHLLNRTATILRLASVGIDKMAFSTVTAGLPCHIQSTSDKKSGLSEGVFSKQFVMYIDPSEEVKAGDRVMDNSGVLYTVVSDGVTEYNFGTIDFIKIVLEKTK